MSDSHHHRQPIIPARAAPLRTLTIAMAVMCFLACLAAGSLILINRSVATWTGDLEREVTVQVREMEGRLMADELKKAEALLRGTKGVVTVTVLDEKAALDLLAPWLGQTNGLEDLPVPRLITVGIDTDHPPDFTALEKALSDAVPGASLDTHR